MFGEARLKRNEYYFVEVEDSLTMSDVTGFLDKFKKTFDISYTYTKPKKDRGDNPGGYVFFDGDGADSVYQKMKKEFGRNKNVDLMGPTSYRDISAFVNEYGYKEVDVDEQMFGETDEGLWDNIRKKKARIARGSGEKMRKPGEKGAPTPDQIKRAKGESVVDERKLTGGEKDKLKDYEKEISKKDFIDRYGKEEGESIYYATLTKMAKQHAEGVVKEKTDVEVIDEKIAGLVKKAEKSGMPYGILKKVYDRGMAAYKTGHRPGTTAQQWAFARVNSFTTKSSGTWGKADADLAAKVRGSKKSETYEIGKDYGDHTRKVTPGQKVTKESIEEWYLDETVRHKYEERYGNNWLPMLTKTYHAMLEKVPCCDDCADHFDHIVEQAEYQGKKVKLNDPIRTSENPNKKFKVYVKNEKGKVVVVRFGDPNMAINRDDPERRKSFRARHNCDDPGPKTKARYWSCFQWRAGAKVDN